MHATPPLRPATDQASSLIRAPETQAFDRWLHDRLGRLFGDVLEEPLPDSLRAILEQHRG